MMISVIMSTYNRGKDISRSIESILNQTYSDFEFIICDDCSTDNTVDIINQYAKKDSRIVLMRNDVNLGVIKSVNKCLKIAKGSLIARMDDDDYSNSNRFEVEKKYLDQHPNIDFVGANMTVIIDGSDVRGEKIYKENPTKKDLLKSCEFAQPAIMIRADAFKSANGYTDSPKYFRVEDYELWLKLYSLGYRGANIQRKLLIYTKDEKHIKSIDRINASKLISEYVKKFNVSKFFYYYALKMFFKMFVPSFIRKYVDYLR
jgi:glycosyltransferase EpsE